MAPSTTHQSPDRMVGSSETAEPAPGLAEHLTLTEAADLLDWLEGHGIEAQEVSLDIAGRLTIRWDV
jgi:hypothetical protein